LNIEHPQCGQECGHDCAEDAGDNCGDDGNRQSTKCPYIPLALHIADSIVDAACGRAALTGECCWPAHAELTIERCTVLGDVCVQQMARAEDSLFAGVVHVERRGVGYMRFCYVPTKWADVPGGSERGGVKALVQFLKEQWEKYVAAQAGRQGSCNVTRREIFRAPTRFKCVPPSAGQAATAQCGQGCSVEPEDVAPPGAQRPVFVSTRYGDPGYCELALSTPKSIRRGAEDESEMGVFHDLYLPQRGAALEESLRDYTPADMDSAVIYADDMHPPGFGCETRGPHCK
jgi:hypothetical protein